jgi:hypothetical protein
MHDQSPKDSHPQADTKGDANDRVVKSLRSYPDMLGQRGAMALAKRLERFWHERGYPAARFWAEPIAERFAKVGTYEIYRVVCNLVNGLPPLYRDDPPTPRR